MIDVYGMESVVAKLPNGVPRKMRVYVKTGRAIWVHHVNNKQTYVTGKIVEGVFVPRKEEHQNLAAAFVPKRDRTDPPKTKEELTVRNKLSAKRRKEQKRVDSVVYFNNATHNITYTDKNHNGYISYMGFNLFGTNVNGSFIPND